MICTEEECGGHEEERRRRGEGERWGWGGSTLKELKGTVVTDDRVERRKKKKSSQVKDVLQLARIILAA